MSDLNHKKTSSSNSARPPTGEHPVLVALQGPLEGRRWTIKDTLVIGREADCDVVIEDRQVSRHHMKVENRNGACVLQDLGSKNGTYCNSQQTHEIEKLIDGDVIQIAIVQKFAFYSSDATMPMEDLDPSRMQMGGHLVLESKSRRVWVGNKELTPPLSAPQFRLLNYLYQQSGKVITRDALIQEIWQDEDAIGISDQALDALIRRLRDRLQQIDPNHQYIVTVRGHGIRMDNK